LTYIDITRCYREFSFSVEANFDSLSRDLKHPDNITQKIKTLQSSISDLAASAKNASVKINDETNEKWNQHVTKSLANANKKLANEQKKFQVIEEKFKEAKLYRKQFYDETIEKIDGTIKEFCHTAFDDQVEASLCPPDDNEPYLGELIYFWKTRDFWEKQVSPFNQNFTSTIALLFAILKLKKQKFVILDDALLKVSLETVAKMEQFLKTQNDIQIISLTSRISDERSDYQIRGKTQSFAVVRMNR